MNSSSPFPLHLLVFSLFIMLCCPISLSNPEWHRNCRDEMFKCGNISAGYPFFGADRPHECGHRGLQLWCDSYTNTTTIKIFGVEYQVLHIDQVPRILKIAREDNPNITLCSPQIQRQNSTLDSELFSLAPGYTNFALFYDCQSSISPVPPLFRCNEDSIYKNVFVTTANVTPETCSANVTFPILQNSLEKIHNFSLTLEEAWETEFEVRWKEDRNACEICEKSGGACGFNPQNQPNCYCPFSIPNWLDDKTCPPAPPPTSAGTKKQGKLAKSVIFGLGFGIPGAVIVGILLGMGILRVRQQRRKKIAAQLNSRDLPTPPSSKGPTTSTTNRSQSNPSFSTSNYDVERGSTYFGAHLFSYEELEQATDNFNPSKELGEGGFGTVYYGVLNDGRVVAVKRLYENNFKRVDQYMNEIDILTRIRHPNLVTLYGCTSRRSRELLLVYEYIPNGTVADHLHGNRSNYCSLTWPVRLNITVETAKALAYLHSEDIIHRDVKSNNILLDKNFHVKVADFGLSRLFPTDVTHISTAPQGTPGYVDPEYHQCYQLTEKSDVYSFGVVLIELISAKQAVDINRHRHDINLANMAVSRIQNQALHELVDPTLGFENNYSVKKAITIVAELAFRCLQQQRDMRPSMAEVLETLTEIQDEQLRVQRAEVVDIRSDDVGLLRHIPPPLSPDSATEKWLQIRSDDVGLLKNVPPPLSKDSATDKWLQMRST